MRKENINLKNDVLEYIGLDLQNIPQTLLKEESIHFSDFSNSNVYRVYEYVSVHDLEILITPLDRTAIFAKDIKQQSHYLLIYKQMIESQKKYLTMF